MAKLPLNGKVWKAGEGFVITIPKLYIDNGWVKVGKKYRALRCVAWRLLKVLCWWQPYETGRGDGGFRMAGSISQKNLFISCDEAETFLNGIGEGEEKYRLLVLLVNFGCRPHEAVALHIGDFLTPDMTRFLVSNHKVVRRNSPARRDLKIIPKWLGEELHGYVKRAYAYGQLKGGYLFPTNKPNKYVHMTTHTLTTWFAKRRLKLGLTEQAGSFGGGNPRPQYRFQLYSFRRLLATEDAVRGVPLHLTAARMGHKDTKTTLRYVEQQRIFELLPELVERCPRFLHSGQRKLTAF